MFGHPIVCNIERVQQNFLRYITFKQGYPPYDQYSLNYKRIQFDLNIISLETHIVILSSYSSCSRSAYVFNLD